MHTNRPGLSNSARQRVELAPERAGDLEVVALVAHDVEEGLVAAELEIFARRVGAERLVGLAVRVAPEVHERRVLRPQRAADWRGTAPRPLSSSTRMQHRPARRIRSPSTTAAKLPGAKRSVAGRPAIGAIGLEPQRAIDEVGGIAPLVVGLDRRAGTARPPAPASAARRASARPAPARWRSSGSPAAPRSRRWRSGRRRRGTRTRSRNRSAGGCRASRCRRSPKRMVMVSPGARKSLTTPM